MSKVTDMRATAKIVHEDLDAFIREQLVTKYQLKKERSHCSYNSSGDLTFTIKFSSTNKDLTAYRDKLKREMMLQDLKLLDLPMDILEKEFKTNDGLKHRIVEIKMSRPRFPVITMASDGKRYKMSELTVKSALGLTS